MSTWCVTKCIVSHYFRQFIRQRATKHLCDGVICFAPFNSFPLHFFQSVTSHVIFLPKMLYFDSIFDPICEIYFCLSIISRFHSLHFGLSIFPSFFSNSQTNTFFGQSFAIFWMRNGENHGIEARCNFSAKSWKLRN